MILSYRLNCIFIHVPKTGGSAISASLQALDSEYIRRFERIRPSTKHLTALQVSREVEDFQNLYSFAVIRHPVDRFYSFYRFLCGRASHAERMNGVSLDAFVDDLDDPDSWLRQKHSARPQCSYVSDETGCIIVSELFRYDRFEEIPKTLSERLGVLVEIGYENVSQGAHCPISPKVRSAIERHYQEDFDLFESVGRTSRGAVAAVRST